MNFHLDHDYTPFTEPSQKKLKSINDLDDELAHTLSILEGSITDDLRASKASTSSARDHVKQNKQTLISLHSKQLKTSVPNVTNTTLTQSKQMKVVNISRSTPTRVPLHSPEEDSEDDEDFDLKDLNDEDDNSDSDYELEGISKQKSRRIFTRRKFVSETPVKLIKPKVKHTKVLTVKAELDLQKSVKILDTDHEVVKQLKDVKNIERKPPVKKEKKVFKPPDDFALFSTPDIIRRVGGKEASTSTPATPTTPEVAKQLKPLKITQGIQKSTSMEEKPKRISTEVKTPPFRISQSQIKPPNHENKKDERRLSTDQNKTKSENVSHNVNKKVQGQVSIHSYSESTGGDSLDSILDPQLLPIPPSNEDIRAIIQNEDTKSFTTSLILPDPTDMTSSTDQNNVNLESGGLDLDQSILDNINSDMISEDILYQVAKSLADNPELQNVIDKSIVDGNLVLDPALQQAIAQDQNILSPIQPNHVQVIF